MILSDSIIEKLRNYGMWVDYFIGKPRCTMLQFKSNNWRKLHGLPMKRRRRK